MENRFVLFVLRIGDLVSGLVKRSAMGWRLMQIDLSRSLTEMWLNFNIKMQEMSNLLTRTIGRGGRGLAEAFGLSVPEAAVDPNQQLLENMKKERDDAMKQFDIMEREATKPPTQDPFIKFFENEEKRLLDVLGTQKRTLEAGRVRLGEAPQQIGPQMIDELEVGKMKVESGFVGFEELQRKIQESLLKGRDAGEQQVDLLEANNAQNDAQIDMLGKIEQNLSRGVPGGLQLAIA
jgi:hypothetical protein